MTVAELQAKLNELDKGVLMHGAHKAGAREFCALEFVSAVRGRVYSDTPVDMPDLRPLNDGLWSSNKARTEALLPVIAALWDWASWAPTQRQQWAKRVAVLTVQRVVANLPDLPEPVRLQCQTVTTPVEAAAAAAVAAAEAEAEAAWAAAVAAAEAARAAWAAEAAAVAAVAAAWAAWAARAAEAAWAAEAAEAAWAAEAAEAAGDTVLQQACAIWIEAADEIHRS